MASERPASGTRTPLPEKVDVAIVGGGIIGASIAWNLATRTDLSVALLDRETVGSGSTSRSAAAFRQQFSSVQHVRMSKYSAEAYRDFPQTFGVDPVFVQNGYLFLYTQAADLEAAAKRVDLQHREGVADAAVLAPADVEALPGMGGVFRTDHLAGATQSSPCGEQCRHQQVYCNAAEQGLYAEPAAGDHRADQRWHVGADNAERCP